MLAAAVVGGERVAIRHRGRLERQPVQQRYELGAGDRLIRAEQPAPQAIPAQKLPEEEEPQRVRPAEKVREKPLEPVQNSVSARFAPAFRRLGQRLKEAPYSAQAGMLGGASRSAMILGLCLLAAAVCCLEDGAAIQSVRRLPRASALRRDAWGQAGLAQNTRPFTF